MTAAQTSSAIPLTFIRMSMVRSMVLVQLAPEKERAEKLIIVEFNKLVN